MPRCIWISVPDLGLGCFGAQDLRPDFEEGVGEGAGNRRRCSQPVFMPCNLGDEEQKWDPAASVQLPDIFWRPPRRWDVSGAAVPLAAVRFIPYSGSQQEGRRWLCPAVPPP